MNIVLLTLQHIETAPKDILGEFPRMTRTEAANSIFQTEAKNKGWITEGPDAVKPPEAATEIVTERMEVTEEAGVEAPSHIKLDPIQEKLLKAAAGQQREGVAPPLAVQQAMAMTGGRGGVMTGSGLQSHGLRGRGFTAAHSVTPGLTGSQRRQTVGLLGAGPEAHWSGSPFGASGYPLKQPPGLMDVQVNEDVVASYLVKQRIVAAKVHEDFNEPSDDETGDNASQSGTGGDETPEVTPPNSREGSPSFGDQSVPPKLPVAQMKLLQRIQQKQKDRQDSDSNNDQEETGGQNEDWYGEEEEDKGDKDQGAPFTLNNLNLPNGLTSMLTAIRAGTNTSPGQADRPRGQGDQDGIGFQQPKPEDKKRPEQRRQDPRRNRNDPRNPSNRAASQHKQESEEEMERRKDERIMDLDLGSFFGDLELPPLTVSPERTEEERSFTDALGLPFKPHIMHEVAKEIEASVASHSPIDWILRPVSCPKPDNADIKHLFSNAQLEADPRLRKFAKSGMAKLKELPLPSFPAPKTDPRLQRKEAKTEARAPDRRRSSEDSEGPQVYNPAKELSRAKQQQQPPMEAGEAYSPGQDYRDQSPQEAGGEDQEAYDPGHEPDYNTLAPPPGDFGHPPPHFPPPPGQPPGLLAAPGQPPFDPHHQGYPPPPQQGNWGRGYPPRGPPQPDPYYQGLPYGGAPFGPPRGKFNNGPPRGGNFNNRGFPPNREQRGGFGNQRRKDPRKRQ